MVLKSDIELLPAEKRSRYKHWFIVAAVSLGLFFLILWFSVTMFLAPAAINQLAEITNTKIKADSVNFSLNGSILIRGLQIKPVQDTDYDNSILRARKVYVRFGIASLVTLKPKIRKIRLVDFKLDFQQDIDSGIWNIQTVKLNLEKSGKGAFAEIRLKNGKLHYTKINNSIPKIAMSIPVDGHLEPSEKVEEGYDFYLATAITDEQSHSKIAGSFKPGYFHLSGSISSDDFPYLQHKWTAQTLAVQCNYEKNGNFNLDFSVENFSCHGCSSDDIGQSENIEEASLATKIQQMLDKYHLSGTIDARLNAQGNFNQPKKTTLNGTVLCKDVSLVYSVFPYSVERLQGKIDFTERNLKAENLTGRHKNVELIINSEFSDLGSNARGQVAISSKHMPLDQDLYKALWPVQKKLWNEFEPTGFVEFNYTFSLETDAGKKYALDVDLVNVNSTYRYFPYPLNNLTGNLLFDVNSIKVTNLKSIQESKIVNINGNVTQTDTSKPRFDLVIDVNNIPLDETLAAALPPKERNLYNQFQPDGLGSGKVLVHNLPRDPNQVYFNANLNFEDTILRPPMLTGNITDITANGIFEPNSITFRQFDGLYAGQPVSMTGVFRISEDGNDLAYKMTLSSDKFMLNEQMLSLISQRLKKPIDKIKPSGTIAYSAVLNKQINQSDVDYNVTLSCIDVNISPEITDMPLEHITGQININKNALTLTNLGTNPQSPGAPLININANIQLSTQPANKSKIDTAAVSVNAENFPVEVKHLEKLTGTLNYDKEKERWYSEDMYGQFYGGKLAGKLELQNQADRDKVQVMLQVGFDKVDLRKFLADRKDLPPDCPAGSCYSTGQMNGQINVIGTAGDLSSFYGSCRVEIDDMQVGRLSPVAKVLTLLKLTKPSDYLFQRMFFNTYIKDKKFYFETFELSGNALNFGGTGWMDIKSKELDLTLAARGPRIADVSRGLIGSLTSAISPAILQVNVLGTANKPIVEVKPFPAIGGTLDLLGTKEK
ncbi:MAG: hypothetical protein JW804_00085 [Sedimentisphaerales bacterium]|nr:hypothetical protein [Sedimentisphaerales bacterium]